MRIFKTLGVALVSHGYFTYLNHCTKYRSDLGLEILFLPFGKASPRVMSVSVFYSVLTLEQPCPIEVSKMMEVFYVCTVQDGCPVWMAPLATCGH